MIARDLLEILCCPESRQTLRVADEEMVKAINLKIAAGEINNRSGKPITEKIDSALLREDGKYLYVIRKQIPVMLIDEAIPWEAVL